MKIHRSHGVTSKVGLGEIRRRADRLLANSAVTKDSHVSIQKEDQWYVFQGRVSCSGTKAALFSLVPHERGAQWIVDRIHVGRVVHKADVVA